MKNLRDLTPSKMRTMNMKDGRTSYCKRNTRLVLSIHHGKLEIKLVSTVHRWVKRAYHSHSMIISFLFREFFAIDSVFMIFLYAILNGGTVYYLNTACLCLCKQKMWKFLSQIVPLDTHWFLIKFFHYFYFSSFHIK